MLHEGKSEWSLDKGGGPSPSFPILLLLTSILLSPPPISSLVSSYPTLPLYY